MRVIRDHYNHAAIEIDPDARLLLRLGTENSVILQEHPATWFEIIDGHGRIEYTYDTFWRPMTLNTGEPYPPLEAIRKMMRGLVCEPSIYGPGVLETVMDTLPHGEYQLFTAELGFLGRYCAREDAEMIARAHQLQERAVIFCDLEEFFRLPEDQRITVAKAVGATIPKKFTHKSTQELYAMSKEAARKKSDKPAVKVSSKQKPGPVRTDGPVAKAREIFAKMPNATSIELYEATTKAGINKGTATVQLGKWRKEQGIVMTRGPKKAAAPKPEAKAAAKKTPATPAVSTKKAEPKTAPAAKKKAIAPARKSRSKTSAPASTSSSQTGQDSAPVTAAVAVASVESSDRHRHPRSAQ